MKTYEKINYVRDKLIKIECDLCGEIAIDETWNSSIYERTKTEIMIREETIFPEGDSGTLIEIDICPKCFKEKLIPWLKENGAIIRSFDLFTKEQLDKQ